MRDRLYDILTGRNVQFHPNQTKAKAHVYVTADGWISMAGSSDGNIDYFVESVSKAVKGDLRRFRHLPPHIST